MILGLFGGSFDPPHVCHVLACQYVLSTTEIDRVLWVPCHRHPFSKRMAPYRDRLEMCRRAVDGLGDRVEISEIESRLDAPNYMIETLRALKKERPDDSLRLVIGSDILAESSKWKDFSKIRRLAPLVVVPRAESGDDDASSFALPNLSSTAIRTALKEGKDLAGVVPRRVLNWIRRQGLYGYR